MSLGNTKPLISPKIFHQLSYFQYLVILNLVSISFRLSIPNTTPYQGLSKEVKSFLSVGLVQNCLASSLSRASCLDVSTVVSFLR
jgi:hypothetical protein